MIYLFGIFLGYYFCFNGSGCFLLFLLKINQDSYFSRFLYFWLSILLFNIAV